jgi:hypothetical protein
MAVPHALRAVSANEQHYVYVQLNRRRVGGTTDWRPSARGCSAFGALRRRRES